jgi:hypothetical protein
MPLLLLLQVGLGPDPQHSWRHGPDCSCVHIHRWAAVCLQHSSRALNGVSAVFPSPDTLRMHALHAFHELQNGFANRVIQIACLPATHTGSSVVRPAHKQYCSFCSSVHCRLAAGGSTSRCRYRRCGSSSRWLQGQEAGPACSQEEQHRQQQRCAHPSTSSRDTGGPRSCRRGTNWP